MNMQNQALAPEGRDVNGDLSGFQAFLNGGQPAAPQQTAVQPQMTAGQMFAQTQQVGSQLPPLPAIEIPEGRALAGRYKSLDELENHASHFQSKYDRLYNESREALEIKAALDSRPEIYEQLATLLERGATPTDLNSAFVRDETSGEVRVDAAKIQEFIDAQVQARVAPLLAQTQQTQQFQQQQHLANLYAQRGIDPREMELDMRFSQQLGQMPPEDLLMAARALRLGQTQPQQFQGFQSQQIAATPPIPRTVTQTPSHRPAPLSADDTHRQAIVNSGRRSFGELMAYRK